MADKRCSKCKQPFPATPEFFRRDKTNKDGLRVECKKCSKGTDVRHVNGPNALCAHCQKPFYATSQGTRIHCSNECRYAALQRKPLLKTWRDYRLSRPQMTYTCLHCGKEFQGRIRTDRTKRFCSHECFMDHDPHRGMIRNKISSQRRTDIEAIVEKCLQSMGIRYEWEKRFGRYRVDFYLPEYNTAIECDGTYWHQDKAEHEKKRDTELKEVYGILVRRFTDKQIYGDIRDLIIAALIN